jgi:hypothetical protein
MCKSDLPLPDVTANVSQWQVIEIIRFQSVKVYFMPPLNVTIINIIGIILYFQGLLLVLKSKFVCKFLPNDLIGMRKHGNKYQVNLHNQKIAKISQDLYAFSVNRSVLLRKMRISFIVK